MYMSKFFCVAAFVLKLSSHRILDFWTHLHANPSHSFGKNHRCFLTRSTAFFDLTPSSAHVSSHFFFHFCAFFRTQFHSSFLIWPQESNFRHLFKEWKLQKTTRNQLSGETPFQSTDYGVITVWLSDSVQTILDKNTTKDGEFPSVFDTCWNHHQFLFFERQKLRKTPEFVVQKIRPFLTPKNFCDALCAV